MTTSRRSFLMGAGAAAVLTAFGDVAVYAQAAKQTVTEQEVIDLFDDVLVDKFNAWKNRKSFDTENNLRQKYATAQNDKQRALIITFDAMGGVQRVIALAEKNYSTWGAPENADRDYDPIPLRGSSQSVGIAISNAVAREANVKYSDGTTFAKKVAAITNESLKNAREDGMTYQQYAEQVLIPFKTTDQGIKNIQDAAIGFGLRAKPRTILPPGTTTIASLRPNP